MKNKFLIIALLLISSFLSAQNDTISLKNNNILVGEIKALAKGVLTMETSFSDSDFKIEFNKVVGLNIQRKCIIVLTNGRRRFGNVKSNEKGSVEIKTENGTSEQFNLNEIIALEEVYAKFWDRIKGSIDLGFNFAKANKNSQFTIGGKLNYIDKRWLFEGSINVLNSSQDNSDNTQRTDAKLEIIRILAKKWYLLGEVSFLSNTEQAIDGRVSTNLGGGKFLVSTNKLYLGLTLGLTYNIENYQDSSLDKTSTESFASLGFNMFDFEDIDINTTLQLYPSLSEKGRVRSDFDLTLKYDLPWDLYIKLGFTLNYDNQPAIAGNYSDYILTTGFGWDFD